MPINLEVILVAIVAAMPGLLVAIVALRKQPAESRLSDAAADKSQHEASQSIAIGAKTLAEALGIEVRNLRIELEETKKRLSDSILLSEAASRLIESLRQRLVDAESRLAKAEGRTAEAERRAIDFRNELIKVGTMLDESRREHQRQIDELVLVVQTLIEQVEQLGGQPKVDKETLARLADLSRRQF